MKLHNLILCLATLNLMGCTYTSAVSQTNIPAQRTTPVRAKVERFIVLGLNFENDYALQLTNKLKAKCPNGEVRGVTTHDTTTLYFFFIFWQREITAEGYCLTNKATAYLQPEMGDVALSKE